MRNDWWMREEGNLKKCSLVTGFGESLETHKPGTAMLLVLQCQYYISWMRAGNWKREAKRKAQQKQTKKLGRTDELGKNKGNWPYIILCYRWAERLELRNKWRPDIRHLSPSSWPTSTLPTNPGTFLMLMESGLCSLKPCDWVTLNYFAFITNPWRIGNRVPLSLGSLCCFFFQGFKLDKYGTTLNLTLKMLEVFRALLNW